MRRQYKRIPCKGDEIRVEIVTEIEGQVSDLSRQGIGVKAPKRVMPGTHCTVNISTDGSAVSLSGTSVWERYLELLVSYWEIWCYVHFARLALGKYGLPEGGTYPCGPGFFFVLIG